jgi:hypothetical protein
MWRRGKGWRRRAGSRFFEVLLSHNFLFFRPACSLTRLLLSPRAAHRLPSTLPPGHAPQARGVTPGKALLPPSQTHTLTNRNAGLSVPQAARRPPGARRRSPPGPAHGGHHDPARPLGRGHGRDRPAGRLRSGVRGMGRRHTGRERTSGGARGQNRSKRLLALAARAVPAARPSIRAGSARPCSLHV